MTFLTFIIMLIFVFVNKKYWLFVYCQYFCFPIVIDLLHDRKRNLAIGLVDIENLEIFALV